MLSSLLAAEHRFDKILFFTVAGVHTEKLGSGNQAWDSKVAKSVSEACNLMTFRGRESHAWYAVHLRWFVRRSFYRRDLDNFRLKPIVDNFTANGLWPDDDVAHIRAIYSEAVLVDNSEKECVEVTIYGTPPKG